MQKSNQEIITKEEPLKENLLLKPKIDVVFQSLFNQNNPRITKAFVETLLEEKINTMQINVDKDLVREKPDDKLGVLDLQLDVNNNEKVDVEIQLINKHNTGERLLYYFSKLYLSTVERGEDYSKSKRVVVVAIIDYDLKQTKEIEKMQTVWELREEDNPKLILTEKLKIVIISLSKAKEMYEKNKDDKKAQWMLFLDDPNSEEVQKEIMEKNEDIKEAIITVKKMSAEEKTQRLAFLREKAIMDEKSTYKAGLYDGEEQGIQKGIQQGIQQGMQQGIQQGAKQEQIKVARKLLEMGMSIEDISKATGLKKEEIEKLMLNQQ